MPDMAVVVLSEVEEFQGSNEKGPWVKFTLKDGNGQVVGATFDAALGAAAKGLIGQRVEVDTKPATNPKYAPTVTAVRKAVEKTEANPEGLTKDEWRAKDRAADKRACIAIAAAQVTALWDKMPEPEQTLAQLEERTLFLAQRYFENVQLQRDEVPFV